MGNYDIAKLEAMLRSHNMSISRYFVENRKYKLFMMIDNTTGFEFLVDVDMGYTIRVNDEIPRDNINISRYGGIDIDELDDVDAEDIDEVDDVDEVDDIDAEDIDEVDDIDAEDIDEVDDIDAEDIDEVDDIDAEDIDEVDDIDGEDIDEVDIYSDNNDIEGDITVMLDTIDETLSHDKSNNTDLSHINLTKPSDFPTLSSEELPIGYISSNNTSIFPPPPPPPPPPPIDDNDKLPIYKRKVEDNTRRSEVLRILLNDDDDDKSSDELHSDSRKFPLSITSPPDKQAMIDDEPIDEYKFKSSKPDDKILSNLKEQFNRLCKLGNNKYGLYIIKNGSLITTINRTEKTIYTISGSHTSEYSMGLTLGFKRFLSELDKIHLVIPGYTKEIRNIITNNFGVISTNIDSEIRNIHGTYYRMFMNAQTKQERTKKLIYRCDKMLKRIEQSISNEEDRMKLNKHRWKNNSNIHNTAAEDYGKKSVELRNTRKLIAETKGKLLSYIDSSNLTFDAVLNSNLYIVYKLSENQDVLRSFIRDMQ